MAALRAGRSTRAVAARLAGMGLAMAVAWAAGCAFLILEPLQ